MRKTETAFLVAVFAFAFVIFGMSYARFADVRAAAIGKSGFVGKARDVDMEKMKRLIRQGHLSEHEAQFYKKAPSKNALEPDLPASETPSGPVRNSPPHAGSSNVPGFR